MYSPHTSQTYARGTIRSRGEAVRSSRRRPCLTQRSLPPHHSDHSSLASAFSVVHPTPDLSRDACDSPVPDTPSTIVQTPDLDGPVQEVCQDEKAPQIQMQSRAYQPSLHLPANTRGSRRVGSKYAAALGEGKRDSMALRSWVTELDQAITRAADGQSRTSTDHHANAIRPWQREPSHLGPMQAPPGQRSELDRSVHHDFAVYRASPQAEERYKLETPHDLHSPALVDAYVHLRSSTAPPRPLADSTPVQTFDIRLSASGTDVTQSSPALEVTPETLITIARTGGTRQSGATIRASPERADLSSVKDSPTANGYDPRTPRPARPIGPRPMPKPVSFAPIYDRYAKYGNTPTASFASKWSLPVSASDPTTDDNGPPTPTEWLMQTVVRTCMVTPSQSYGGRELHLGRSLHRPMNCGEVRALGRRPSYDMATVTLPLWTVSLHPPEQIQRLSPSTFGQVTRTDKEIFTERETSDDVDELDEYLFAPLSEEAVISGHTLGRLIGKGVAGRVRLATGGFVGDQLAIKLVTKPFKETALDGRCRLDALDRSQKMMALLDREVVVSKLLRHPGLARTYKVIETPNEIHADRTGCLMIEYIPGGELFDLLVSRGALAPDLAARYFYQILHAIHHMHTIGLIHRDIKPENMLIDNRGGVKIVDFGMTAIQPPARMMIKSCGSPHYACPEICRGDSYMGEKADVWSLGVVLYALLNGSLPFDSKSIKELLEGIQAGIFFLPSTLPWDCRDLIWSMLILDPHNRPSTAELLGHPFLQRVTRPPRVMEPTEVRLMIHQRALRQLQHIQCGTEAMPVHFKRELIALGNELTISEWEEVKLLYTYLLLATFSQPISAPQADDDRPRMAHKLVFGGVYPVATGRSIESFEKQLVPSQSVRVPRLLPPPPSPYTGTASADSRQITYSEPDSYLPTPQLSDAGSSLPSPMLLTPKTEFFPLSPVGSHNTANEERSACSDYAEGHGGLRPPRERHSSLSVSEHVPPAMPQGRPSLRKPKSELALRSMPSIHSRKRDEPKPRAGSGDGAWSKLVAPLMRRMKSGKIAANDKVEKLWAIDNLEACIVEAKRVLRAMQMTVIDQDAEDRQLLVCYFDHIDCSQRGKPRYVRIGFKLSFALVAHPTDTILSSSAHRLECGEALICSLSFQLRSQSREYERIFRAKIGEVRRMWQLEDFTPQIEQHARMSAVMPAPKSAAATTAVRLLGQKSLSRDWEIVDPIADRRRRARTLTP